MASIKTNKYREKLAKALAGTATLPAITRIGLGSGGVDVSSNPRALTGDETALFNPLVEKDAVITFPTPYTTRYTVTIDADSDNLVGVNINEAALRDAEGELAAIKTFTNKGLETGTVLEFDYDAEQ